LNGMIASIFLRLHFFISATMNLKNADAFFFLNVIEYFFHLCRFLGSFCKKALEYHVEKVNIS